MDDSRPKRVSLAEIVHALFGAEGRDAGPVVSRGGMRIPVHAADGLRTLGLSLSKLGAPTTRSRGGTASRSPRGRRR